MDIILHPLTVLVVALGLNVHRHRHGKSTICSVTRSVVPTPVFLGFLAWFVPHWLGPKLRHH